MWFNKKSVFPALWSGSATPRGEDNRRGLIRITFILTRSVLLSHSEKQVAIRFRSCRLWTERLILVAVKRSAPRWWLHSASALWMTLGRREEVTLLLTNITVFFIGINWGEWWLFQLNLLAFTAQEKLSTWLRVHGFACQSSSFCFIQLSTGFDLLWPNMILSDIIYLCSKSLLKLVARLVLISIKLGFHPER